MKKLFFLLPLLIIFLVPLILVSIWFREGYMLGAAEAELPFYNLKRFADRTEWAWTDFQLGYVSSFTVASYPTWLFLSWIQNMGIPPFLIQAAFFYFLFVVAGLAVYFLTKELFPNIHPLANFSSVAFYWFNPISLANIWNRFLYNFMSFFALVPAIFYLFIRGIHQQKYRYSIFVNLSVLLFSFSLTSYVFNILIWGIFGYTTLFYSLISKDKKTILFNIKYLLLTILIYVCFNFWWLLSTLNLFSSEASRVTITANVFTTEGNLQTLLLISQKLGNFIDIVRLMHFGFYNGEGPAWAANYNNWFMISGLFVISSVIFWAILKLTKERSILYLGFLFILSLFLSKGSNPPFGEIFKFFFEKLTFLQVFRNPFEKFGFLLQVLAAPLFGYGVFKLGNFINKKGLKITSYLVTSLIVVILLGYSFLTGLVFTGPSYPNNDYSTGYKVEVPPYYQQADQWLTDQGKNFRFIGFPLGGEGITYNWTKGYQGVELSNTLFSTPNILFNTTGWPHYYQLVNRLEELLFIESNFSKIATTLNAKYLMIRSDINYRLRGMRDPKSVENRLDQLEQLEQVKKVSQFGNVNFWQNLNWNDSTIYTKTYLVEVRPNSLADDILLREVGEDGLIYQNVANLGPTDLVNTLIIHPTNKSQIDLNNVEYTFSITEEGNYNLLLDNNYLTKSNDFVLSIDGHTASQSAKIRDDNKLFYGNFLFNKGVQKMVFNVPNVKNLIDSPESFILNNINHDLSLEIKDFDPYAKYFVIFDVLINKGSGFIFGIEEGSKLGGERIPLFAQSVPNDGKSADFRKVVFSFPLDSHPEKARFFLKVNPQNSEVFFKNVFFGKLLEFSPMLIRKIGESDTPLSLPLVSYVKQNPIKYLVKITGAKKPFALVLSELYHPAWEAEIEGESINQHFLANSFANGWLIERSGDFTIKLEFSHQKLLNLGRIISILSFLVGLIYIGILCKRKLWK